MEVNCLNGGWCLSRLGVFLVLKTLSVLRPSVTRAEGGPTRPPPTFRVRSAHPLHYHKEASSTFCFSYLRSHFLQFLFIVVGVVVAVLHLSPAVFNETGN